VTFKPARLKLTGINADMRSLLKSGSTTSGRSPTIP
jgi:hypothetical protein